MPNGFYYVRPEGRTRVAIYAYYKDGQFWAGHEPLFGVKVIGKTL